jgi:F0F1-type ATP synthase delta subunit
MTEQEEKLARKIAVYTVEELIISVQNEVIVGKIVDVWASKIDRTIGRGLRRLGFYLLITFVVIGLLKLGLVEKFISFLKP